ncbi:MAG: TetR family transcriptional regulator [Candidatus Sulfotelmatobacter sp.]
MTEDTLQVRKQQLVRNAIYDAAIDLFAKEGFDETTVEEVAQAAGVSRRSFFRYFASKDDLLAQNVVHFGSVLSATITACPPALTPLETVRETVLAVVRQTAAHPRTRQIIEISQRSASARQAHHSRMMEVEDTVAAAFAARLKSASKDDLKPRLLASLTLSIMNLAIFSWFRDEYQDLSTAARQVFTNLTRIFFDQAGSSEFKEDIATTRRVARPIGRRKSGQVKH